MTEKRVDLGFLEECDPWLLINTYFPSKVGGRPAWLDVESIPTIDQLKCSECGKQLAFLCQVCTYCGILMGIFKEKTHHHCNILLFFTCFERCMLHWTTMKCVFIGRSMFSYVWIHNVGSQISQSMV